jgi:hypothetical protein
MQQSGDRSDTQPRQCRREDGRNTSETMRQSKRKPNVKARSFKPVIAALLIAAGFGMVAARAEGLNAGASLVGASYMGRGVSASFSGAVPGDGRAAESESMPTLLLAPALVILGYVGASEHEPDALRADLAAAGMSAPFDDKWALLSSADQSNLNLNASTGGGGSGLLPGLDTKYALLAPHVWLGSWESVRPDDAGFEASRDPFLFGMRVAF